METHVEISRSALKGLKSAPKHIQNKVFTWVHAVQAFGIEAVRQAPGYHDEPIQGRNTQRSIRLSRQWRAFYTEHHNQAIIITIVEVTPHDYRKR